MNVSGRASEADDRFFDGLRGSFLGIGEILGTSPLDQWAVLVAEYGGVPADAAFRWLSAGRGQPADGAA